MTNWTVRAADGRQKVASIKTLDGHDYVVYEGQDFLVNEECVFWTSNGVDYQIPWSAIRCKEERRA